eukprot:m.5203 g.5203  ORF g.5203 m.5203 type:complete len:386 (+) comp4156_c0_seq2:65-1222(+)
MDLLLFGRAALKAARSLHVLSPTVSSTISPSQVSRRFLVTTNPLLKRKFGMSEDDKAIPSHIEELVAGTALEKAKDMKDLYKFLFAGTPPDNFAELITPDAIKSELRYLYPNPLKTTEKELAEKRPPIEELSNGCVEIDPYFRPRSNAHFTGHPRYYDLRTELELLISSLDKMQEARPSQGVEQTEKVNWMKHNDLQKSVGETFKTKMYEELLGVFDQLYYHPLYLSHGENKLRKFIKSYKTTEKGKKLGRVDDFGRARSLGKRKSSTAQVMVWKVDGEQAEFIVNGTPLAEYFLDKEKVLQASAPLRFLNLSGSYSVATKVRGGGVTGQADAIALGISRGLVALLPDVADDLERNEFLIRDSRTVEPKKPGQKKARKKFQWVKR